MPRTPLVAVPALAAALAALTGADAPAQAQPHPYGPPPRPYAVPPRSYAPPPPAYDACATCARRHAGDEWRLNLSAAGLSSNVADDPVQGGGVFGVSMLRHQRLSAGFELEVLGARDPWEDVSTTSVGLLVPGRFYFWEAPVAPFLHLAGGIEHVRAEGYGASETAGRLVGQAGGGLELRFGDFLSFEGVVLGVGKVRMGQRETSWYNPGSLPPPEIPELASGMEIRLGLSLRF